MSLKWLSFYAKIFVIGYEKMVDAFVSQTGLEFIVVGHHKLLIKLSVFVYTQFVVVVVLM